jgi:probable HAF family extracellular repeat protein
VRARSSVLSGAIESIWRDGKITDFGAGWSEALAVNDNDEVVGSYVNANNERHAFVWRRGVLTELPGYNGAARGINNKGVIVGTVYDQRAFTWGVVWRGGQPVRLGESVSEAVAINDHGVIAGNGGGNGWYHGLVWKNGAITDLPAVDTTGPWRDRSDATTINNRGEVIGLAATATGRDSAIWRNGKLAVGFGGNVRGINNRGQIVGNITESPNQSDKAVIWG